jgi:hypothetical protein
MDVQTGHHRGESSARLVHAEELATQVRARREVPVILTVDAAAMHVGRPRLLPGRQRRLADRPRATRLPVGLAR